jgi:transketolase
VEAGVSVFWKQYVGLDGRVIGIDQFGASGKAPDLFKHFGFTAARILETVEELIGTR